MGSGFVLRARGGVHMRRREFITLLGGTAAAWSSLGVAQPIATRPIVGMIAAGTPSQYSGLRLRQSFLDGMRDLGYIEGRNFDIVGRPAATTSDLPKAAEELVQLNPNVIFAGAAANALATKRATTTIPIVVSAL